jgi:hypothetical protein
METMNQQLIRFRHIWIRPKEAQVEPTILEILEYIDPDWRDHFIDPEDAAKFYQRYALEDWMTAVRELRS